MFAHPIKYVRTLADLKKIDCEIPSVAILMGNTAAADGNQGLYYYDPTSTAADNSATSKQVIQPVNVDYPSGKTQGRWIRFIPDAFAPTVSVTQPASGSISHSTKSMGNVFQTTFTLAAARMSVTDAAGSGSYGTLDLMTLPEGAVSFLGCRQNYTAFAEGAALTGAAGDAAFKIGVGTVAKSAAADGALAGANDDDIGGEISITLSGGTGTGTTVTAAGAVKDGTSTAAKIILNWSGSAATIDANSTIDVTGTITVLWAMLGDD
jgi:hypothetical protein